MKKILLLLFAFCACENTFGQTCTCTQSYAWLKETFEKNDAGFQLVIDKKGEADYKKHCEIYAEKVKSVTGKSPCVEVLSDWLRYFRRGHLWLDVAGSDQQTAKEDKDAIRKQYKDWETYPYKEKEFKDYVSKLKEPGLEGIWSSPPYSIGIKKVNNEYIGFVIEADGVYWSKSQVKFKVKDDNGALSGTYYMRDHSSSEIKNAKFIGKNHLSLGTMSLKRVTPTFADDPSLERYFRLSSADKPVFEKISEKTVILRIPSFDNSHRRAIDSVIKANMPIISKTENLIIDLQNNGGGSDGSYSKLIPLIYTDPIRVIGLEYLSTPLNNQRLADFAKEEGISESEKAMIEEQLQKLNSNLGKFVNLESGIVDIDKRDTVYAYPKKVGVIINGGCGSTTEQFILAAKQSKKVKLFGTTTFGSLDVSNMHSVISPCKDMELGYCLSKSFRIPDFTIDGKGLQPDYYIDASVPKYEWINFVNEILSK
jgi:hypothetical protein